MLSPLAVSLGIGQWGKKDAADPASAGPSSSSKARGGASSTSSAPAPVPVEAETSTSKSAWSIPRIPTPSTKALYGLGAVAIGAAAAGTAYYRREDFLNGWKWGFEHMTFVKNLWDAEGMGNRLEDLDGLGKEHGVRFWK